MTPIPLEAVGTARSSLTVDEAVSAGCGTVQLKELSLQIIEQAQCSVPDAYVALPSMADVSLGNAVLPYLEAPARDALVAAIESNPGQSMQINSMLRTVAQQYLLYRWYQLGICGIGLAATPGNSNHETGLAIDIQQYNSWLPTLEANGFSWLGASDPVHFDYVGPGAVDHSGLDVLAFQQLWNLNHPEDIIAEDGSYGPQTEARLKQAPAEGFAIGPDCASTSGETFVPAPKGEVSLSARFNDAADPLSDGPSAGIADLFASQRYTVQIDMQNPLSGSVPLARASLQLPSEYLIGEGFSLESNITGSFEPIVVPSGNPPANEPLPANFDLLIGNLRGGETVRLQIPVSARGYSVEKQTSAAITVSSDGSVLTLPFDMYDERRYEWNGGRLEGWTAAPFGNGVLSASLKEQRLEVRGDQVALTMHRLGLTLPVEDVREIRFRGQRSGGQSAAVFFAATDGAQPLGEGFALELNWPADGEMHEVVIPVNDLTLSGSELTGLGMVIFSGEDTPFSADFDYLRIGVDESLGVPGADSGCSTSPGGATRSREFFNGWAWLCLGLVLGAARRRRRPRQTDSRFLADSRSLAARP